MEQMDEQVRDSHFNYSHRCSETFFHETLQLGHFRAMSCNSQSSLQWVS